MKRIYSMVLILCIAFSMVACHSKTPNPTIPPTIPTADPTDPTVEPTEPTKPAFTVIRQEGPFSRENVSEFITLLHTDFPILVGSAQCQEWNCYNDTPPGIFEETGIQIFSFEGDNKSFLLYDNKVYYLSGNLMTGDTIINAIAYDFDGDGIKELLFSHLRQAGSSDNIIAVFNPVSKEITQIDLDPRLLFFVPYYITPSEDNLQSLFTVWHAHQKFEWGEQKVIDESNPYVYDNTLLAKEYTLTTIAGYITLADGKPTFVPYTE